MKRIPIKAQGLKRTFVFVFGFVFGFGFCFGLCFCFFSFLLFIRLRLSLNLLLFALVASFLYFGLGVFISNSSRDRVSKDRLYLKGFAQYVSIHSGFEMVSRWMRSYHSRAELQWDDAQGIGARMGWKGELIIGWNNSLFFLFAHIARKGLELLLGLLLSLAGSHSKELRGW